MNQAARGERIHIGVFGRRNAGKSSLLNALTGQQAALVSDVAGTTTDPVYQPMELHGAGAVVFIDTAGFDGYGDAGRDARGTDAVGGGPCRYCLDFV